MNFRHYPPWPVVLAATALALQAGLTEASTCKDELRRFETRLYDSSIPARQPQLFQELVRKAERAAELRDEQRCLQRVAELNEAIPDDDAGAQPTSRTSGEQVEDAPSRPEAPVLLVAGGEDEAQADALETAGGDDASPDEQNLED